MEKKQEEPGSCGNVQGWKSENAVTNGKEAGGTRIMRECVGVEK
ncbi:MAG: hypothetical protein PHE06_05875 [Lachnospiraceae bacterium]|nr:hypothetical protein [Lachnospiraceae bacterium]